MRSIEREPSQILFSFVLKHYNSTIQDSSPKCVVSKMEILKMNVLNLLISRMNDRDRFLLDRTFWNENIYNPVKQFGHIILTESKSGFDFFNPRTNFRIKKGDTYLSIHLSPADENNPNPITNTDIVNSMRRVARYIKKHRQKLPNNPIIGITYEKLAKASRRYGFTIVAASLPQEAEKQIIKTMKRTLRERPQGNESNVLLFIQSYDDLIARFQKPLPAHFLQKK